LNELSLDIGQEPSLHVRFRSQEPSLHVRFRSQSDAHPLQEPVIPEPIPKTGDLSGEAWNTLPLEDGPGGRVHLLKTQEPMHAQGDIGMTLSCSPSQTFFRDPRGKTHVLLFQPTDSIPTNLLCYSSQLHLPPLAELYILSGSPIIQAERTGIENGLHHEPHLRILLRCRGGMRGGTRGSANGSSGGKGRGNRASEGNTRGMGGGPTNVENSHTPQMRGEQAKDTEPPTLDEPR